MLVSSPDAPETHVFRETSPGFGRLVNRWLPHEELPNDAIGRHTGLPNHAFVSSGRRNVTRQTDAMAADRSPRGEEGI